jgi:hypothetical protein
MLVEQEVKCCIGTFVFGNRFFIWSPFIEYAEIVNYEAFN